MKKFLLIASLLVAMTMYAEVTKITPMLSAVKVNKGQVVEMNTPRRVAPSVKEMESDATTHRLDSVVGFNSDQSKGTLMRFVYDENGWWTETHNYYYNSETQSWGDPVQSIYVVRKENGYVLSESNIYNGYGVKSEYVYDDRDRGIMKTNYFMNPGEDWIPTDKGEYTYDDNDNIIEEYTYYYDAISEGWVNSNHNLASWDDKGRQTSIDSFYWNGEEWERSMKLEYRWFDGPHDPDLIPGADPERLTYRLEYMKFNDEWLPVFVTENFFDENGRVSGQAWKYYNRENDNYFGGDNYDGMLWLSTSWISELGYDEFGIQNLSKTYYYIPGTEENLVLRGECSFERQDIENGDFILLVTNRVNNFDDQWNVTDNQVIDKAWYAYDANGRKLWCYEEMPDYTGAFVPQLEDKWEYDENGNLVESVAYNFQDGQRVPSSWESYVYDEDGNQTEILGRANADGGFTPLWAPARESTNLTDRDYRVGEDDEAQNWKFTTHWVRSWGNGQILDSYNYRWDGENWVNNQGQINTFDFSVEVDHMLVPPAYTDVYKIDCIERLYGNGDAWLSTKEVYYYTDMQDSSVDAGAITDSDNIIFRNQTIYANTGDVVSVDVFDMTGRLVLTASDIRVSLSDLAKGVYVVEAQSNSGSTRNFKVFIK